MKNKHLIDNSLLQHINIYISMLVYLFICVYSSLLTAVTNEEN